jgi:hypothetical protein
VLFGLCDVFAAAKAGTVPVAYGDAAAPMTRRRAAAPFIAAVVACAVVLSLAGALFLFRESVYGRSMRFGAGGWTPYAFVEFLQRLDVLGDRGRTFDTLSPADRRLLAAAPTDALDWASKDPANPLLPASLYAAARVYLKMVPQARETGAARLTLRYLLDHYPDSRWAQFARFDLETSGLENEDR